MIVQELDGNNIIMHIPYETLPYIKVPPNKYMDTSVFLLSRLNFKWRLTYAEFKKEKEVSQK